MNGNVVELHVLLDVEDGWPPVALEGLPCRLVTDGYQVESPPLFIKGISCGDVISVERDDKGNVSQWAHVSRSGRTTIWLLRMEEPSGIESVLNQLRLLGCHTVQLPQYGSYAVDVPADCAIENVDDCLALLDESRVAIAYPSFRHGEA